MNKFLLYALIGLVLIGGALSSNQKAIVLKLNYDKGNISLLNSTIKYGFFPDNRYQNDYGYRLEIVSFKELKLYELRFKAPNEIFIDGTNESGELSGGKILLDNVNFALTLPYYEDMKEIRFYSPDDMVVGNVSFEDERKISLIKWGIIGLIAAVTVILMVWIFVKNRER